MPECSEKAFAKINVYLRITSRRTDGYHNIESLMQTVSLADTVYVSLEESAVPSVALSADGNDAMPCDDRNLAWRAATRFFERTGICGIVSIRLEKKIPMAAGLAGGSSDAAAVLRALNRLSGEPLSVEELCSLGAKLGADVPFCVRGGSAVVGGIGDQLTKAPLMPDAHLVVAHRGEGVSTPWAYGELDRLHDGFAAPPETCGNLRNITTLWKNGDLFASCGTFFNQFEEVVPRQRPDVGALISAMREGGAVHAMMSGSGPSVFGVFRDAVAAQNVCDTLRGTGAAAFVCSPVPGYDF